ncbi:undecaprenyl-diphosphatase BcrC [Clostridium puniceum]|uniref:Undecaprenyl-diphosphatase BcrC n=1 Tax=Clostridium puniceum TaxID=29367 RepID=A0A1S8THT5_9CLOT|nr:phosphatase PAP2 family protein [Clostridium puniceum]OOM77152.1 undecaprenyl-diphosphatase BcrC [Clostridium puniceum]
MYMIQNLDNSILQFIQINMRSPLGDKIMISLTSLGDGATIWMMIGLAFFISKKYRKYSFMIIVALILCYVIGNLGLKLLVARARPFDVIPLLEGLLIKSPTDFSFPSGHTMCSFAASVVIFYMNKRIGIFALILSSFIGFSRLYLYVHYPSDVLGGMIIGIIIGISTIIIFKKIKKQRGKTF